MEGDRMNDPSVSETERRGGAWVWWKVPASVSFQCHARDQLGLDYRIHPGWHFSLEASQLNITCALRSLVSRFYLVKTKGRGILQRN